MTFIRLSRRSRIACAFALVVAAALTGWFWPDKYHNAVRIGFPGAETWNPDVVSFTITNRSMTDFALTLGMQFPPDDAWEELDLMLANPHTLPGRSSTNCSQSVYSGMRTHRWRLAVEFTVRPVDSPILRARWQFFEYAHKVGWVRFGEWLRPTPTRRYAYGPEMLGTRPVAPIQKGLAEKPR
jgi:hypothetical protein